MGKTKLLAIIGLVAILISSTGTGVTQAVEKTDEVSQEANDYQRDYDKNIKFRTEFGLKMDSEYVHGILKDKSLTSGEKFGVVLTNDEEKDLNNRFELQQEVIPQIKEIVLNNDELIAGIYIDQSKGGVINVGIKKPNLHLISKIESLAQKGIEIKVYDAKYSEEELDLLNQKIFSSKDTLEQQGIKISYVSTNIPLQKVDVAVESLTQDVITTFNNTFESDMINLKEDSAPVAEFNSYEYSRPMQAGFRIDGNNGGSCTAAFSARESNGTHYIVTAGHCPDYIGEAYSQGGTIFGYTNRYYFDGGNADAAAIAIDPSTASGSIFAYGVLSFSKVFYVEQTSQETVGQTVCISGGNSNNSNCGTLQSKNYSVTICKNPSLCKNFSNMRQASYTSQGGDSGSPIWAGYMIMGVHSAAGGIYSHVQNVISKLGVYPVTQSP